LERLGEREQPAHFQLLFAIDRVKTLAVERPEWRARQPFQAVSDGDLQMLQWTTAGAGRRLGAIIQHTDAEREWAYDRESPIARLDRALAEAAANGWIVVSMKDDKERVFPFKQ
jgi:hypothetical protein